ncbi:MAG: 1,4-alpha-glucan branching enzyme [Myxococcota bacterium]|jgi:1,4-alpha-glucan branching enzyme
MFSAWRDGAKSITEGLVRVRKLGDNRPETEYLGGMSVTDPSMTPSMLAPPDPADHSALCDAKHAQPHSLLGLHAAHVAGEDGWIIRAFNPDASSVEWVPDEGSAANMQPIGGGLFAHFIAGEQPRYRFRFAFADGSIVERGDPYRFLPLIGELDQHLISEGTHLRLWQVLGANARIVDGEAGTAFGLWAPNASRVSVVGNFNGWDGRVLPMRSLGTSGIWELFVPGIGHGEHYRFELLNANGKVALKADPCGQFMDQPPETASRIWDSKYRWDDATWMDARRERDIRRSPMSVYEVHPGSWKRVPEDGDRSLSWRELAVQLADHCKALGFDYVEFMPLTEHPYYPSWGYQVSGYFAPTSRYGNPDDLKWAIDHLHQRGIGVILDWVPAHFPRDAFALAEFDGTALYEHADPRLGAHPDWGTLIFNYGRNEVRNFLVASALYWIHEFHIDGLRVDAVASMLYLDYSREAGEWLPNKHGGRENLDAIAFLQAFNTAIEKDCPGAFTVAEESTAWEGVTRSVDQGGLGFALKWNMGWMHDSLSYFGKEPIHRSHHQNQLTFAMIYEYDERFLNPLGHDEVVHGKGSLLSRMPGDKWQQLANLRALYAYQWTRPGKQLLFMGQEFAADDEWSHEKSLDWHLCRDPSREGVLQLLMDLNRVYREHPAFWERDPDPEGFSWIHDTDAASSVFAWARCGYDSHVMVLMNLTPVAREHYRFGAPRGGKYRVLLNSDDAKYGGSGFPVAEIHQTDPQPLHGREHSLGVALPPLSVMILAPVVDA